MADGRKCPQRKGCSGDDHLTLTDFSYERWLVINGTKKEDQHTYVIFQADAKGEEIAKTWYLTDEQLKEV